MVTSSTLAALLNGANGQDVLLPSGAPSVDAFRRAIIGSDPLSEAGAAINAIQPNYNGVRATDGSLIGQTSTPKAIGLSAGQAFLGSILHELGKQNEEAQISKVAQIFPQLLANPASVQNPGIESSPFDILKMDQEAKKAAVDEAIRASTAESLARKAPLDTSNMSADFAQALKESGGDVVMARDLVKHKLEQGNKDRASQATLQGISNSISVIHQLEALKKMPQDFKGSPFVPDFVTGIGNTAEAVLNPTSESANYNSAVIPLTDTLLRALTQIGRGSQYNLKTIQQDLGEGWAKGPETLAKRIRNYQNDLLTGGQQRASDLVAGGYTGTSPILSQISGLDLNNLDIHAPLASNAPSISKEDAIAELKRRGVVQ